MDKQNNELVGIVKKFAESGWDVIGIPSKAWLGFKDDGEASKDATIALLTAVKKADKECGSCGCELDPLYKRALELLNA